VLYSVFSQVKIEAEQKYSKKREEKKGMWDEGWGMNG
jgi:hypothetical protein